VKRFRLKLSVPGSAWVQRMFPNAFTFVAWLRPEQAEFQIAAVGFLSAFGVGLTVEETT
jgi:hypothetical protein